MRALSYSFVCITILPPKLEKYTLEKKIRPPCHRPSTAIRNMNN